MTNGRQWNAQMPSSLIEVGAFDHSQQQQQCCIGASSWQQSHERQNDQRAVKLISNLVLIVRNVYAYNVVSDIQQQNCLIRNH